jgi:hypothetical protein
VLYYLVEVAFLLVWMVFHIAEGPTPEWPFYLGECMDIPWQALGLGRLAVPLNVVFLTGLGYFLDRIQWCPRYREDRL